MKLERFFSSSNLFATALVAIIAVGGSLVLVLQQFEQSTPVESNIATRQLPAQEPIEQVAAIEDESETEEGADESEEPKEEEIVEQATPQRINVLSCANCTYAAVDKDSSLSSSYIPSVEPTGLAGGGSLTLDAKNNLVNLFADAKVNGIDLEIISAFRSFATQETTFNYWVSTEVAKGLSQSEAEIEANTYSARPGQSEHQLGTTVDLKCLGCTSFDAAQNAVAYDFIENNAHKYGFVISYPTGQSALTGYDYEPWHIRWIGKDLASELNNLDYISGNGNYLAQFLRDKGLSN